jgi:hypothetical protein
MNVCILLLYRRCFSDPLARLSKNSVMRPIQAPSPQLLKTCLKNAIATLRGRVWGPAFRRRGAETASRRDSKPCPMPKLAFSKHPLSLRAMARRHHCVPLVSIVSTLVCSSCGKSGIGR